MILIKYQIKKYITNGMNLLIMNNINNTLYHKKINLIKNQIKSHNIYNRIIKDHLIFLKIKKLNNQVNGDKYNKIIIMKIFNNVNN